MIGYQGHRWECKFWYVSRWHISLGLHVDLSLPNIELHIPTGFIRIGRVRHDKLWPGERYGWNCAGNINWRNGR